jgi:hypothetical protein
MRPSIPSGVLEIPQAKFHKRARATKIGGGDSSRRMQTFGGAVGEKPPSRWPVDGSTLDRLDKRISAPLLRLQLGYYAEVALSIPGCFFGMPALLAVTPSVAAAASASATHLSGSTSSYAVAGVLALVLAAWALVLSGNERVALALFSMRACVVGPLLGVGLVESNDRFDAAARASAHLMLLSWFLALAPTLILKSRTKRRRPIVCRASELGEEIAGAASQKRCAVPYRLLNAHQHQLLLPCRCLYVCVCVCLPDAAWLSSRDYLAATQTLRSQAETQLAPQFSPTLYTGQAITGLRWHVCSALALGGSTGTLTIFSM